MATPVYNVPPGPAVTLAAVLNNGNDAGTFTITARTGSNTIWNATSATVPNVSVQGNVNLGANAFSTYPLAPGTDIPKLESVVTKVVASQLTTTSATVITSATTSATNIYIIRTAVTVISATTTLSLSAAWTDSVSSATQTYTWENASSLPVGTRLELPVVANALSGTPISVSATAGTASQVYVNANINALLP